MSPNVLWIIAHDSGRESSVYGGSAITPALKAFATTAVVFTNAFAVAPSCSPSRSAMMTGLYPHQSGSTGLAHLGFELQRTDRHLAARFAAAGYRTVLCGIQHEVEDHRTLGYSRYIGADPEATFDPDADLLAWDATNAKACAQFLATPSDEPWLLSLGLFAPHRPFADAEERELPEPPYGLPPTQDVRTDAANFRASMRWMDRQVGTVLEALDRSSAAGNTIVIVSTDHGIDFPRYKATLSDGGLATMLIVRTPTTQPAVCHDLVSLIDLYPTVHHLVGLAEPADADRSDARPIAALCPEVPSATKRQFAFSEINYHVAYEPVRSVRGVRFRYVRRYHSHAQVPSNIGDSASKERYLATSPPVAPDAPRAALYDCYYDRLNAVDVTAAVDDTTLGAHADQLDRWMAATDDPLLVGPVPAPPHAAVAPPEAYSSRSADRIGSGGPEEAS